MPDMTKNEAAARYVPLIRPAIARLIDALAALISHDAPLGLPVGSGRLIMALGLVMSLVALVARGINPNGVGTLATAAVAFYFAKRNGKSN